MIIEPANEKLEYCGRIDFSKPHTPLFIFPASYVKICFYGSSIGAVVTNKNQYWDNYLGVEIDGAHNKIKLENNSYQKQILELANNLEAGQHTVMLYKRQDACHAYEFHGFILDDDAKVMDLPIIPNKRIEVYGDSVSAGEVSEAEEFKGKEDPKEHKGEFSNSYYSYSWILARKLGAQLHDIAQGGIALLDNTGYYNAPNCIGMESVFDKINYNICFGAVTKWNFGDYVPQLVIVALGQNDNNPWDYMKYDYNGAQASDWKTHYRGFVQKLRELYPKAHIVLNTTILNHDEKWDLAIEEVCNELQDERIHHFVFFKNGCGTPGHVRGTEAEAMAEELREYVDTLNIDWDA